MLESSESFGRMNCAPYRIYMTDLSQTNLMGLLEKQEPLCDELAQWLVKESRIGFDCIKHPLFYSIYHVPQMNALVNRQFELKKQAVAKALSEKNFTKVVSLHERPWRIQAFIDVEKELSDKAYWETLHWLWTDSENIWQNLSEWRRLLSSKRSGQFMYEDDLKVFQALPDSFTVYRGYERGKNFDGVSYTLEREKAEWFSRRFCKASKARVRERVVKKSQVFAYTDARSEKEIIIL